MRWHPIMSTVELEPGVWHLTAQYGDTYGEVRLLEIGGEWGYRGVLWSDPHVIVGYYRNLFAAVRAVHLRWLSTHATTGGINGGR